MAKNEQVAAWWFKATTDGRVWAWHRCTPYGRKYPAKRVNTPGVDGFECGNCGQGAAIQEMAWWEPKQ